MLVSHCHVQAKGFGDEVDRELTAGTLPHLVRVLRTQQVDQAVVFAPFDWQDGVEPNEWLLSELPGYPQLIGFATVHPLEQGAGDKLRHLTKRGLMGAKLHPPVMRVALDDPRMEPYWRAAEELHLPIHVHTGVHGWFLRHYMPILLDDVCQRHPELPIIMDHMGGVAFFHQALAVLHNNPNTYVGMTQLSGRAKSYALQPDQLKLLLETVGPERIVYGFDYPWNPNNEAALRADLEWVRSWGISSGEQEMVLGGTMAKLLANLRPPGETAEE